MNMIWHNLPFLYLTFFLLCEAVEHFSEFLPHDLK